MARFHVENFGCRTSRADGDAIAAAMGVLGAEPSECLAQADVVVVNTCSVTAEADRDARAYIRKASKMNPGSRIVVTGCYAQRAPEEIAALPGVAAVVGNSHKNRVATIALHGSERPGGFVSSASLASSPEAVRPFLLTGDIFAHSDFQLPGFAAGVGIQSAHRTRPSLKIQDGCGNRCTFCIIPSIRGNSRSLPRDKVLESVRTFVDAGGTELVLSGINLGRWGRDLAPQSRLEDLLAEIFATTALPRLRISSVEPMDWTDGLIGLFASLSSSRCAREQNADPSTSLSTPATKTCRWGPRPPRLARHVHMPLQSGCDSVLRRMHRRYRPWHYAERAGAVRAACPDAAIGADVMVGFPGETDAEFQESHDFIAAQPLTYLHLFPFSARPATRAWELNRESPVAGVAVRERMAALRSLAEGKNLAFRSRFVGTKLSVVTLIPDKTVAGRSCGLADNFLPIELEGDWAANLLLPVQITGLTRKGLTGVVSIP